MLTENLADLEAAVDAAQRGEMADIARLREQRGAHNQRFTVTIFAMFEISRCMEAVRACVGRLAGGDDGAASDPATAAFVSAHIGVTERRYGLTDTGRFLGVLADALESGSLDQARSTAVLMSDYLNFLQFLIAVEIPWHELGVAFEGARTVDAALQDRMVAEFG